MSNMRKVRMTWAGNDYAAVEADGITDDPDGNYILMPFDAAEDLYLLAMFSNKHSTVVQELRFVLKGCYTHS